MYFSATPSREVQLKLKKHGFSNVIEAIIGARMYPKLQQLASVKDQEAGPYNFFSLFLFFGFAIFYVSLFLPISSKWNNNIFFVGILFPVIASLRWHEWKNFHRQLWLNIYCILIVYLLISHLWSSEFSTENFSRHFKRAIYVYGFIYAIFVIKTRFAFTSQITLTWIGLTAFLLSAPLLMFIHNHLPDARLEGFGQFYNSNDVAILGAALIGIALFQWQSTSSGGRFVLALSIAVLIACIILSHSRSGLLALIACLSCASLLRRNRMLGLFILLLVAATIWLPGPTTWLERGLSLRDGIWQINWQRFQSCSLLGCGLGTPTNGVVNDLVVRHAHSILFSMLFYGGIIALALYVLLITRALFTALITSSLIAPGMTLLAGFIGTLTTSDHILISPDPLWIYLLAPLALICFSPTLSD